MSAGHVHTTFASDVNVTLQVGCLMTCSTDALTATESRTLCEWEYRVPYDKEVDGSTLRNWVDVNDYPTLYAGTMDFAVQCTHIFDDAFPDDEFDDSSE